MVRPPVRKASGILLLRVAVRIAAFACCLFAPPVAAPIPNDEDTSAPLRLIHDTDFDEILSRSFEAILSDSQRSECSACASQERRVYRTRFWNRCDPTPATAANEFPEEHLSRMRYALERFCPAGRSDWAGSTRTCECP